MQIKKVWRRIQRDQSPLILVKVADYEDATDEADATRAKPKKMLKDTDNGDHAPDLEEKYNAIYCFVNKTCLDVNFGSMLKLPFEDRSVGMDGTYNVQQITHGLIINIMLIFSINFS